MADPARIPHRCAQVFLRELCSDGPGFRIVGKPHHHPHGAHASLRICRDRPARECAAEQRDELAAFHVWMAPVWQEIIWRAAQRSLAVMCPACWCSPGGLLALMGSANRGLII